ncbi:M14 family zinc carboxypeptidase [Saccharopolyspora mangrovi]|uniref:M14 family zinc carboxypeptidase n=1 Tax=Saccharopolyspora mangrovi TaxID=3082379 RepID=A0ABU6AFP1_9PSEU|nr:M14 family zinc carboxypeptidase [Saccharopolyspora sp. S2-29]MEB3370376.1 M14 family zinc carboxypeptidase [Saccharopolyspora sp. S2-29]
MSKTMRYALLSVLVAVVTAWGLVAPAGAAREIDPRPSTEELARQLFDLQVRSRGEVRVRPIGTSNQGRPVWSARVGHGPQRLLYVTQQHGDEPLGTPAAMEFLRDVGVGNDPHQRWLRDQVTVDVVVRANPDGHELNWRYNYDPDADPEFGEAGKGYDINRYHDPAVAPEDNPATEAGLIQRHHADFTPQIAVDFHMQGRYVDGEGREITASLMWPTNPGVAEEPLNLAKQVSVVARNAMDDGGANVSQYPGGEYQGIARNAYGLLGSGSVLIELSDMGPAHEQFQISSALASMHAIANAAADGSVHDVDPAQAEAIPPRGEPVPTANATRTDD